MNEFFFFFWNKGERNKYARLTYVGSISRVSIPFVTFQYKAPQTEGNKIHDLWQFHNRVENTLKHFIAFKHLRTDKMQVK